MSGSRRARLAVVGLLLGGGALLGTARAQAPAPAAAPAAAKALGALSGRVVSADTGAPVPSAVVVLQPIEVPEGTTQTALANDEGWFSFPDLRPGRYAVRAERAGYAGGGWSWRGPAVHTVVIAPGQNESGYVLPLPRGAVITGFVYDGDGVPIEGVSVFAYLPRFRFDGTRMLIPMGGRFAATDDRGKFRIYGLEAGSYLVAAGGSVSTGYGPPLRYARMFYPGVATADQAQMVTVEAGGESDIAFTLGPAGGHAIHVFLPSGGAPRAGYSVVARWAGWADGGPGSRYFGRADENGGYVIPGVPDGVYTVTVRIFHFASGPRTDAGLRGLAPAGGVSGGSAQVAVSGQDASVNVAVGPLGSVRVHLSEAAAAPARVAPPQPGSLVLHALAGADIRGEPVASGGDWRFSGVMPGQYLFRSGDPSWYVARVRCGGQDDSASALAIGIGDALACDVTLAPAEGVVVGAVARAGRAAGEMTVVAIATAASRLSDRARTTTTDAQGRFQLDRLAPGDYVLFAVPSDPQQRYFAPDFLTRHAGDGQRVSVANGAPVSVTLTPATLP